MDSSKYFLGLRLNMYVACVLTVAGATWFVLVQRRGRKLAAAGLAAPELAAGGAQPSRAGATPTPTGPAPGPPACPPRTWPPARSRASAAAAAPAGSPRALTRRAPMRSRTGSRPVDQPVASGAAPDGELAPPGA